jgi:translin
VDELSLIAEQCRNRLDAKNTNREALLNLARVLTRHCANTIRALHRKEWGSAQDMLAQAKTTVDQIRSAASDHPDLYFAGYTQDALKEYVEAAALYAMLRELPLPTPDSLALLEATYLNGLTEAASELRRYILDIIREDHSDECERLLDLMDTVYTMMVTIDFPDAISGGLRHRTDALRGVLERTRGDVTMSLRQQRLEGALRRSQPGQPE